jgi:nicotinamidase-related amidase
MIINQNNVVLLIVDFQERLFPKIENRESIIKKMSELLKVMKIFNVPIIHTEQIKLGDTISDLSFQKDAIQKVTFSCIKNKVFENTLKKINRKNCILTGIETHICILQTALDLLSTGYSVFLPIDCIGSRNNYDHKTAIQRLVPQGVIPTTAETIIYEILKSADTKEFKQILTIIKEYENERTQL